MGPGKVEQLCLQLLKRLGVVDASGVYTAASGALQALKTAVLGRTTPLSIASEAIVYLTIETEISDPGGLHDTGSPEKIFTAPVAGVYALGGYVSWRRDSTAGFRWIVGTVYNSSNVAQYDVFRSQDPAMIPVTTPTDSNGVSMNAVVVMEAGDYMKIWAYQYSDGSAETGLTASIRVWQLGY